MPIKNNGYSHNKMDAKRDRKRKEAFERQYQHESLSIDEKIAKAKSRSGENKKELNRLLKLKANPPVSSKKPMMVIVPKVTATEPVETKARKSKKEVIEAAKRKRPAKS